MSIGKGQGLAGGFNDGIGFTRRRRNTRSFSEMRRAFWLRVVFPDGEVKLMRTAFATGTIGLFLGMAGPKIRVDNGQLQGISKRVGKPMSATIRQDGRQLGHVEVMRLVELFLKFAAKKKQGTIERLKKLDAALEKIGKAP